MIYTIITTTFMSCYIYHTQSLCHGIGCYYHILSEVKRGKGMKRRIKYIISKKSDIVAYYDKKYKLSTFADLLAFRVRPGLSSLEEFDFYCTCTPLDLGPGSDTNPSGASPTTTPPLDSIPDDAQLSDFVFQAGGLDAATDIFKIIKFLCTSEMSDHDEWRLFSKTLPFYKFRFQLYRLRSFVLEYTGITLAGWFAYFLAYRYIQRHNKLATDAFVKNHGEFRDNCDDNGYLIKMPHCKDICHKPPLTLSLCVGWVTYCNTKCMVLLALNTSSLGLSFWSRMFEVFISILGDDNEFTDFFRHCFSRYFPRDDVDPENPAPRATEGYDIEPDGGAPVEDLDHQDFLLQAGDYDPMEILRMVLKEETFKTIKSSIKVLIMISGVVTLLNADFTGDDILESLKSFDFARIFSGNGFTNNVTSAIDFINRLIEAYQTGSLKILFGIDKVGDNLLRRARWFNSIDVASLSGGVVSFDGNPTPSGSPVFYVHEFQGYGSVLLSELKAYLAVQEAKIGNSASVKTWRLTVADVNRKMTEVLRMLESLGMRKKPFTFMVVGTSSVGKTTVTNIMLRVLCHAFKLPSLPSYIYYLNDSLKHWDGFHVMAHTLIWDDASCVKLVEGDPGFLGQFLNVVGNQPYTSPQAHLDNKAMCKVRPRIFGITSNTLTLQASKVMNADEAVMRRVDMIVQASLKPNFNRGGMLANANADPKSTDDLDYWNFKVYTVKLNGGVARVDHFVVDNDPNPASIAYNGFTLERVANDISLCELNKLTYDMAMAQDGVQDIVMNASSKISKSTYDPALGKLSFEDAPAVQAQVGEYPPSDDDISLLGGDNSVPVSRFSSRRNSSTEFARSPIHHHMSPLEEEPKLFERLWSGVVDKIEFCRSYAGRFLGFLIKNPVIAFPTLIILFRHLSPIAITLIVSLLNIIPSYIAMAATAGAVIQFTRLDTDFNAIRVPMLAALGHFFPSIIDADYVEKNMDLWNEQAGYAWYHPYKLYAKFRSLGRVQPAAVLIGLSAVVCALKYAMTAGAAYEAIHQGFGSSDDSPAATWSMWSNYTNLSHTSKSVANPDSVVRLISNNVLKMCLPQGKWTNCTVLKTLGAYNLAVTTLHSVRPHMVSDSYFSFDATLVYDGQDYVGAKGGKITPDIVVTITTEGSLSIPEADLFFFVYQGYHHKDICEYFCKRGHVSNSNTSAFLPARSSNNEMVVRVSKFCHVMKGPVKVDSSMIIMDAGVPKFKCQFDVPTVGGNCGSPYIQTNGKQTAIVGLHQMGAKNNDFSLCTQITQEDIELAVKGLRQHDKYDFVMQNGGKEVDVGAIFNLFEGETSRIEPTETSFPPLHYKSVFRQIDNPDDDISGTIRVLGSIPESSKPLTTKIYPHPYRDELLEETGFPTGSKVPPPRLSGGSLYRAKRHFIDSISQIRRNLPYKTMRVILYGYICDAFARLYHPDLKEVAPITVDESINGKIKDGSLNKYMGKLIMSTSAGFPYNKPKKDLLAHTTSDRKVFIDPIMKQIDTLNECLSNGVEPHAEDVLFSAFMKDEPISQAKADACKRRIVIAGPVAFVVVFRQYFLPIIAFMAANRLAFEACPSTVVQSAEWSLHREYVSEGGTREKYFDGDYKGWDSSLQKAFVACFFMMAVVVAKISGNYSERDIRCMVGLASVIMNSKINFFGDIIELCAFMPSGQPATAQTNCVGGSIMLRLAWYTSGHCIHHFRHAVRLLTYGDDNWGSFSANVHDFDKGIIARQLKEYGITYTNANKTECTSESSSLDDVEFLKRTWLFDPELGYHLAPLSRETLGNMCCNIRRSVHETEHDVVASTLVSMVSESFYHGPDVYRRTQTAATTIANRHNLNLPDIISATYESRSENFLSDSQYFIENWDDILQRLCL